MQILRSVVAQCYRGGRSIGNRQSRDFTSLTRNNDSNGESLKAVDWLYCGLSVFISYNSLELTKVAHYMEVYEDIAAKEGKIVDFDVKFGFLWGRTKVNTVYVRDDPKI